MCPYSKFWLPTLIWRCIWYPSPLSPDLGFEECWRSLTGVLDLDLDLDMVTHLWCTHVTNFGSLTWFWRCKEHPCPLSPHLGLWRMLEVPDWILQSWSLIEYGFLIELEVLSKFQPSSTAQSWEISKSQSGSGSGWVLIWGFGGCLRFLIRGQNLNLWLKMGV